jgi:hypothetical protein
MDFAILCIFQLAILWIFALQLSTFLFYNKHGTSMVLMMLEKMFQKRAISSISAQ